MWTPVTEKVDASLTRWEKLHPTLEARCQILQITVGSMSQYLTQVNEMPPAVFNHLLKAMREFMWGGKSPPINFETLTAPRDKGGKNLLDLKARNDALHLMKLKSYLDLDPSTRAEWCYLLDRRLAKRVTNDSRAAPEALINTFLQSWRADEREWPKRHKSMMRSAKKFGISFDVLAATTEVLSDLPIWHHHGENPHMPQTNNSPACYCLRGQHGVIRTGDGLTRLRRLDNPTHKKNKNCKCVDCDQDRRNLGCANPHACAIAVEKKLSRLMPKWDPRTNPAPLDADDAESEDEDPSSFPPVRPTSAISEGFRILTCLSETLPSLGPSLPSEDEAPQPSQAFFTKGITIRDRDGNTRAAGGLWYDDHDERNTALLLPIHLRQTARTAELAAALHGVQSAPRNQDLIIYYSQKSIRSEILQKLDTREASGWIGAQDSSLLRALAAALRGRTGKTTFVAQDSSQARKTGKAGAVALARQGARKREAAEINPFVDPEHNLRGVQLSTLTQKLAYRGIKQARKIAPRMATTNNVKEVTQATFRNFGFSPTEAEFWSSIRHKDFSRQVKNFLYKSAHSAHRIGAFWKHIPECEERGICCRKYGVSTRPQPAHQCGRDSIILTCRKYGVSTRLQVLVRYPECNNISRRTYPQPAHQCGRD
ncbi:hypothetical protein R3P38DRAFT_2497413 [Favolaschia claudopus]|uniref:RNase H type-1 domain-containing protein n=1 Tax=Favolaschia claudopus TaxID=2862362 RepID=A0AAW0E1W8_9AGAR